jgi:hypothetical protein
MSLKGEDFSYIRGSPSKRDEAGSGFARRQRRIGSGLGAGPMDDIPLVGID